MGQMWKALPEAEREKYKASLMRLPTSGRGGMRAWIPANMALTPPSAPVVASHPARDPPPAPAMAQPLPSPPARAMAGIMFGLQQRRSNAQAAEQAATYYTTHQGYIAPAPVPFGGPAVLASHARSHAPLIGAAMGQVVQDRCASRISAMPSAAPAAAPSSATAFAPAPPHSQGSPLFATNPANAAPVLTTGPFGTRRLATDVQELTTNAVPSSKRAAPAAPPGKQPCTNPSDAPAGYVKLCRQAPASFAGADNQQTFAAFLAAPHNTEFSSRAAHTVQALQQAHAWGLAPQSSENFPGFDNFCMLSGGLKGLGPLPRMKWAALGRGCGSEGSGAQPLPRAAVISTGFGVR